MTAIKLEGILIRYLLELESMDYLFRNNTDLNCLKKTETEPYRCTCTWDTKTEKMNSQYFRHEVLACETGELKNFWEKTIEKQTQHLEVERVRKQKSALAKLRNEWTERLEKRLKMIKAHNENKEDPNCG